MTVARPGIVLSLTLLLASLGACRREEPKPPVMGPPEVVVARPVAKKVVEWDRFVGRFRAVEEVEVRARISGYLEDIHFEEGAIVKQGELLFTIDSRPFEATLAGAEAAVTEARARREESAATLAQARAELAQAQAEEKLAQSRLDRATQAVSTNAIAKEQVDVRQSALLQAQAGTKAAGARIAAANAAIATAEAAIITAQAAVRRAKIDVDFCRISASISGRIGRHRITRGNLVDGGTVQGSLLTTIVALDPIHCEFDASEQDFLKYSRLARQGKRGSSREVRNPVFASLIDETDYPHRGHMDYVDNRIDRETATIRGRAIFRNPDNFLTPGLFATVRLPGTGLHEVLLVPDGAVGVDQGERFVMVVDADGTTRRRPVVLGPRHSGLRIVREGLGAGDRIVTRGLQRVRDGAKVVPREEKIEPRATGEGLPDLYEPVPRDQWISRRQPAAPEEEGK